MSVEENAYALTLDDVGVTYGGIAALSDVCLHVRRGEVLGVIGPNGAGKTTLFDTIAGTTSPTRGRITLHDRDITGLSELQRARLGIRRTFQKMQVFGWLTVRENIQVAQDAVRPRRRGTSAATSSPDALLASVGLDQFADRPAGSLPIARARMLELARALAVPPALLLLDEPASGLGAHEFSFLDAHLSQLRQDHTCAVVLIEHDIDFVMKHSDRVVVLELGQVIAEGSPAEIMRNKRVQDAYLGTAAG